jgi:FAD/FMN-containing dehydrogenase
VDRNDEFRFLLCQFFYSTSRFWQTGNEKRNSKGGAMAAIIAVTVDGATTELSDADIENLTFRLQGRVLLEGAAGYDECRAVWNRMVDRRPALIVKCADASDVVNCVNFSRSHGLPISVRSGGHNVAGTAVCDKGLMLDLSGMKEIQVDSTARIAWAEPGVTSGEIARATEIYNLATPGGICFETGITGAALGGGIGWMTRKHGLALDNILSLEMVTADGKRRKIDADNNTELFNAVRGTHSNFGVVTNLEFQLHPVGPEVLAGMVMHELSNGKEALQFYREFTHEAPDEMATWAALMTPPDGQPMVAILACYIGGLDAANEVAAPLKQFGPPAADMLQPMPYVNTLTFFDEAMPKGRYNYWKSNLLKRLSDNTIEALVDGFKDVGSPYSSILIEHLGGAMSKVSQDATAFGRRDALYDCVMMPAWTDPAESESHIAWADTLWRDIQPDADGVYVNYLGDEGEERVRSAYGPNYDRLARLKAKYDPTNLFCINQNIKPQP